MTANRISRTTVSLEIDGAIGTITLNRPDKLNAISSQLATELVDLTKTAASDDRIRALVITGEGRAFCAGGDIDALRFLTETQDRASARELMEVGRTLVLTLQAMTKPTLAAVNGAAVGAGASLALACDIRLASSAASFGQTFSRVGLHPDWGSTYFLPRVVGAAKALELILSGDIISSDEALRLGIFNRVVPKERLPEETRTLAVRLANSPPIALALARRAVYQSSSMSLQEMLNVEIENQLRCVESTDAKEGMLAFLEKRAPTFRGI